MTQLREHVHQGTSDGAAALRLSSTHLHLLACSYCSSAIQLTSAGAHCRECGESFRYASPGLLDMRLHRPKRYVLEFEVGSPISEQDAEAIAALTDGANGSGSAPYHLSGELMAWFPRATAAASVALDLGCGSGLHRDACREHGFDWIGLDYASDAASLLGDAHALPFQDESFDLVLSIAVMEHIQHPLVMTREAFRVLKPGARFVGTVAFLEPFHGNSYYHHTHLGTINSLRSAGFAIERLSPVKKWPALVAQAEMALFPGMPNMLARGVVTPVHGLHRLWWRLGALVRRRSFERTRASTLAGAFEFVARRPESGERAGSRVGRHGDSAV